MPASPASGNGRGGLAGERRTRCPECLGQQGTDPLPEVGSMRHHPFQPFYPTGCSLKSRASHQGSVLGHDAGNGCGTYLTCHL